MSKRNIHPAGPANMRKTTHQPAIDQNDRPFLQKVPGFSGFKGWVYHPTRGFKKVSGFIPPVFKATEGVDSVITEEDLINEETNALLSEGC